MTLVLSEKKAKKPLNGIELLDDSFSFSLDPTSSDEGIPLSGEEEFSSKCSYNHRRLPTHVYKEYLPSTIYRTGEARSVRVRIE